MKFFDKISFSNPNIQILSTAAIASIATASILLSFQKIRRNQKRKALKQSYEDELSFTSSVESFVLDENGVVQTDHEESLDSIEQNNLMKEQLSRNYAFLGEEGMNKLNDAFVIVVGAGGVGSWAAYMLLRSGVRRIRIIDFDQVTLSSLNRHAVAVRVDVGTPKVNAIKKHLLEVNPSAVIEPLVEMFNEDNASRLLSGSPDFVLDCIDNTQTKLQLLKYCKENSLKVISSMGSGAKADPSRIQIADISETFEDPLARTVRRNLKKVGIDNGIPVVYSTEKPNHIKLLPLDISQDDNPEEFAILPDFRARILPVLGTLPAIFGMVMATYVILRMADYPINPLPVMQRDSLYSRLYRDLCNREKDEMKLDRRDIAYVFEEIWRGKSAISQETEKLVLMRWLQSEPLTLQNCVCLTKSEAKIHEEVEDPESHYSNEILEYVRKRLKEEALISKFR